MQSQRFPVLPLVIVSVLGLGGMPLSEVVCAKPTSIRTILPRSQNAAANADLKLVRTRLRDSFIPAPGAIPGESGASLLKTLRGDGSWADQVYTDTDRENWKAGAHLGRLLRIAHEYFQPGSPLSKQAGTKARIITSLAYWLRVDPKNTNWWHNEIGVPLQVGELLILLGDDAPPEVRQSGMQLMTRAVMEKMTGQNLVWTAQIQIVRACISNNPGLAATAYNRMWQEVRYAGANEEGIQVDNSFHQHGPLLYAGGYGAGFTSDLARFVSFARGTRFALPAEKRAILDSYVLDGQQWMLRGQYWDYGVTGRELIRAGKNASSMVGAVSSLAAAPGPRQAEMKVFAARLRTPESDDSPLTGNRHYWLSDYMTHERPGYFASTHMFSVRTVNTDGLTNGENKTSHHIADGAMYLARDGEEYVGIYPVWDWRRIPGTTIEQNTPLIPERVRRMGTTRFVGGVSDGKYGIAAMDLSCDALSAQKVWFYFDSEIVCLGTGINCATNNNVVTTVNQCLLRGSVYSSVNPEEEQSRGLHFMSEARNETAWVWHDEIGYIFPQPGAVQFRSESQTGSLRLLGPGSPAPITKDVFSLWINQGAQAKNRRYAYIIVPAVSAAQTAAVAKNLPLTILTNETEWQAVWHQKLRMLAVVFRKPTKMIVKGMTISVDQPCLLLARREGGTIHLALSNPENEARVVNVTVQAGMSKEKQVRIELPGGLKAGQSVVCDVDVR